MGAFSGIIYPRFLLILYALAIMLFSMSAPSLGKQGALGGVQSSKEVWTEFSFLASAAVVGLVTALCVAIVIRHFVLPHGEDDSISRLAVLLSVTGLMIMAGFVFVFHLAIF